MPALQGQCGMPHCIQIDALRVSLLVDASKAQGLGLAYSVGELLGVRRSWAWMDPWRHVELQTIGPRQSGPSAHAGELEACVRASRTGDIGGIGLLARPICETRCVGIASGRLRDDRERQGRGEDANGRAGSVR